MSDIHYLRESDYQRYMQLRPHAATLANLQLLEALDDVEEQITQEEVDGLLDMLRLQHEFLQDILGHPPWRPQGEPLAVSGSRILVNWAREGF